ncbi:MAG: glycosyltransferase family 2 protein [Anaerolineae bacterium]|nr:glycosyltransferase family 2 protein [Anaerolineae bacterium]
MGDVIITSGNDALELSILMPCLNEAETLELCINKAQTFLYEHNVKGEVIIADNGSTDGSQMIATRLGAKVIQVKEKGYGAALLGGIEAAEGQYIIMGDSDDSYDFTNLMPFVEKLREGYDLVMGNRFKGGIAPGAMPPLHRYLGNPVLSWLGRLFFQTPISDFHCGLRGFNRSAVKQLDLQTTGMEFASEMVVKASLYGQSVAEVPTTLSPDGRSRQPHLRSWRDGWRHLRFLLLYSPRWLFLIPGLALFGLGMLLMLVLLGGPVHINGLYFGLHYMVLGSMITLIGFQIVSLGIYASVFSVTEHYARASNTVSMINRYFNLERGIGLGSLLFLIGVVINLYVVYVWLNQGFAGQLRIGETILAMTLMVIGVQTVFSSFFLSLMGIQHK